jgi:parallel beta-helix repeat protein
MVEKIFRYRLRFLVGFSVIIVLVLFFAPCRSVLVFSGPPASGDWVVTGSESYYDEVFVLNGNLVVEDGGNLTFRRVTLKMNCAYDGQYNITVKHGGSFYVLEGSVITSANPDKRFAFTVWSTFRMSNSELHECGWTWSEWETSGLLISSDDAVVENSLISHNWNGINVCSDGVVVRNNNVTANSETGITVSSNSTIYNNHVSCNNVTGIGIGGHCSPIIYNNTVMSNLWAGINPCEGASPIIQNNIIKKNGIGIFCVFNSSPIISGNLITVNLEEGIGCWVYCSSTIANNTITSNLGVGIHCGNHSDAIIQGNTITNNTIGIFSHVNSNPTIEGNIITSNRGVGVSCEDNSLPEVHWNDIYDNEGHDVANYDPSVTVNATYNYWKDGPSTSSHVLYDPWSTESIFFAEITSPLSSETVSSTVTVSTKVDARSGVHRVEFYIDDQLEYTDYDVSYEWNWDTTQYMETEHKITAKAYDMLGLKISTSITVFVDNTAPTVLIKEPKPENNYYGTIRVRVNATDNQELANVHFRVDDTEWLAMTYNHTELLWKYYLNTTTLSDGQHTLMVLALDKASNPATTSTTLLTDNIPPTLTIQTPQAGMTVGLTLVVDIQASDVSGISRIEFYLQDVLVYTVTDAPYQWSWDTTKYSNGEYTITIKAYDTVGHTQTSETTVTVKNVESLWWQEHLWTIIQVLIAVGGLIVAIIAYVTRRKEEKKKKK